MPPQFMGEIGDLISTKLTPPVKAQLEGIVEFTGKVGTTEEWLCLIKSKKFFMESSKKRLRRNIIRDTKLVAVPIIAGSRNYLKWLESELQISK
jgi:uncharacterized protein involved in tolerance to divalent cations